MTPEAPSEDGGRSPRLSIGRASSSLAFSSVLVLGSGLITGPILARTLGPEGRGVLASVAVTVAVVSTLLSFSLPDFVTRQTALGRATGQVLGSVMPPLILLALLGLALMYPLSRTLADDEGTLRTYLLVGAWLFPLAFLNTMLIGLASGLQRWTLGAAAQAAPPLALAAVVIVLAIIGELSVETAALATVASPIVALLPLLLLLRRAISRLRFDSGLAKEGLSYGGRASVGVLAISLNARLDQLLMIALVSARELGLYTVAVTLASLTMLSGSALAWAIFPRVAAGESALTQRACRTALLAASTVGLTIGVLAYPALWIIFGRDFIGATPMVLILLVAFTLSSINVVLAYALRSVGRPGIVSVAEVAALALTVPGVLLLVPPFGGVGAAVVTAAAAATVAVTLLRAATNAFGGGPRDYLRPQREDVNTVVGAVRRPVRRGWDRFGRRSRRREAANPPGTDG